MIVSARDPQSTIGISSVAQGQFVQRGVCTHVLKNGNLEKYVKTRESYGSG